MATRRQLLRRFAAPSHAASDNDSDMTNNAAYS